MKLHDEMSHSLFRVLRQLSCVSAAVTVALLTFGGTAAADTCDEYMNPAVSLIEDATPDPWWGNDYCVYSPNQNCYDCVSRNVANWVHCAEGPDEEPANCAHYETWAEIPEARVFRPTP